VVVAESRVDEGGPVRDEMSRRVRQAVGVPLRDIVLVTPGTLPKTSSGKLQRALCRSRYLSAQLQPI
jgi:fatty-acyl-CoA synthase